MTHSLTHKLTSAALTLTLLAAGAFTPRRAAAQTQRDSTVKTDTYAQTGHTYWQHPDYDAVLDIWRCAERGVCVKVHSVNAENQKTREAVAKDAKKDIKNITPADVAKFCAYEAQLVQMKEVAPGDWRGKIWIASRNSHFGVDIHEPKGEEVNLKMRGYIVEGWRRWATLGNPGNIVGKTMELAPVKNPPAPCVKP